MNPSPCASAVLGVLSTAPRSRLLALFRVVLAPGPTPPPPARGTQVSFCLPPVILDVPLEVALAFPALPGPLCCLFLRRVFLSAWHMARTQSAVFLVPEISRENSFISYFVGYPT